MTKISEPAEGHTIQGRQLEQLVTRLEELLSNQADLTSKLDDLTRKRLIDTHKLDDVLKTVDQLTRDIETKLYG